MPEISEVGSALHAAAESGPECSRASLEALVENLEEQERAVSSEQHKSYYGGGFNSDVEPNESEDNNRVISAVAQHINERNDKRYTPLHSALFAMYV